MATTRIRGQQLNLTGSALLDRGITMTALKGISAAGPTNITFGANDIGLTGSFKLTKTTPTEDEEVASKAYVDSSTGGSIPKGAVSFGQYDGSGFDGDPNLGTFRLNSAMSAKDQAAAANLTVPTLFHAASGSGGLSNLASGSVRFDVARIALTGSALPASGSAVEIKATNASGYVNIAGGSSGHVNVEGLKITDAQIDAAAGNLTIEAAAGTIGIGADAVAQNINIGTGAAARTITIGNATGASALDLDSGTGGVNISSTGAGDITIDSDDELHLEADGALEVNSSAGAISIGNDAVAQAINIGTGAAARTITVGNTTGATKLDINLGTGGLDVDVTNGPIALDTTNTGTGITVGTVTSGVPISIGHTTSETTVNDNLTVTGHLSGSTTVTVGAANATQLRLSNGNIGVGHDGTSVDADLIALAKDKVTVNGELRVSGDLNVLGTSTAVSSSNLMISDPIIALGVSGTTLGQAGDRGIVMAMDQLDQGSPSFFFDYSGTSAGTVTGSFVLARSVSTGSALTISAQSYLGLKAQDAEFGPLGGNKLRLGVAAPGEIDTSAGNLTLDSAGGTVVVDDALQVASTIGVSGDADLMTLADKSVTISGDLTVNMADASTGIVLAANQLSSSFVSGTFGAHFGSGYNNIAPSIGIGRSAAAGQALIDVTTSGADAFGSGTNVIGLSPTSVEILKNTGITGSLTVAGALTQAGGAVTINGNGASSITTAAGNMALDSAAVLNIGATAATQVNLGRSGQTVALAGSSIFSGGDAATFQFPNTVMNRVQGAYAGADNTAMTAPEGASQAQLVGSTLIAISGSNSAVYKGGSEMVYLNGLLLLSGAGNDYHVTSSNDGSGLRMRTITLSSPLISGDVVQVKFVKFRS